jgi:hypothetical protein
VNRADRLTNLGLLAAALAAWALVAVIIVTFDPRSDATVLLAGALMLGAAIAGTLALFVVAMAVLVEVTLTLRR